MYDDLTLRVTPVTVPAGIGQVTEIDLSGAIAFFVAEMTKWGTAAGEVSLSLGDQGDFFDVAPGDYVRPGGEIRRVRVRNNTAFDKKIVLWYSMDPGFECWSTNRGL